MPDSSLYRIILASIVLLIVLIGWLLIRRRRSFHGQLVKSMSANMLDHAENLVIPDGLDGWLQIRHLFRLRQGFLIIETCNIDGHIYAAENMQQWRSIVAGRSYPFINPLQHCRHAMHAIHQIAPEVPVFYHVVFPAQANFPKGKPSQVSVVSQMQADLQTMLTAPTRQIDYAEDWQALIKRADKAH